MPPAAPRTKRPVALSRAVVVEAAAAVVAREGVEALTMRRLAVELGAAPMAVYRHVRDKDDLLVALLDAAAPSSPTAPLPEDPRERVLAAARMMHDALAAHPWAVTVLAKGDLVAPSVLWLVDGIVGGLLTAGLDPPRAVSGYRAIWAFTLGDLMLARSIATLGRPPAVLAVLEGVDPDTLPALAEVAGRWRGVARQDSFDAGLTALVEGLLPRGR